MEIISLDYNDLDPESLQGVVVRKHNDLVEAKYQIQNIQEQRVILMLLAQIKPNDEDFKGYRIAVTDFAKIVGIRPDNIYERLEATAQGLLSRNIKIKNGKSFLMANWLSSAEYKHGSGYIELCFDPKLKPYLLQLQDHFTRLEIDKVLHFKSIYSIRLYELLKKETQIVEKYQHKKQFEKEFSYLELREAFGVGKKEYTKFNDFKRKTIEPAVTEIDDKTELNISDVIYGKTGRAVSKITFVVNIREKAEAEVRAIQTSIDEQPKEEKSNKEALIEKLTALGYSFECARRDVNKYGIQRIERSMAYTLAKQQAGEVKDFPSYLSRTIADDLGGAWEQAVIEKKEKAEKQKQAEQERKKQEAKEEKAIKEKHKKVLETFYILPEVLKKPLKEEFKTSIEDNSFVYPKWIDAETAGKDPLQENIMLQSMFTTFLIKKGF